MRVSARARKLVRAQEFREFIANLDSPALRGLAEEIDIQDYASRKIASNYARGRRVSTVVRPESLIEPNAVVVYETAIFGRGAVEAVYIWPDLPTARMAHKQLVGLLRRGEWTPRGTRPWKRCR